MNLNAIFVLTGAFLFLLLCAATIRIFNKSKTFTEWFSYLLHQIGVLLLFLLFLDIQLLLMLVIILVVWGAAYYSLSWGEAQLSPFWNSVLIAFSFIYFFMLLWWSGTKGYYRQFSFRFRDDKVLNDREKGQKQSVFASAKSIMGKGMSFLIPLMIIIGLVMLGSTCFGALTAAFVSNKSISFQPISQTPGLSELSDYYLWHFLELIPQIEVTETLMWEVPFTYREKGAGWILLIFKALMAYIVIARFYTWNKWRKELNKSPDPSRQWCYLSIWLC